MDKSRHVGSEKAGQGKEKEKIRFEMNVFDAS